MGSDDDEEEEPQRTTTVEILATFDPPWKWDELGLRLHDSPHGVTLDHIAVRSPASQIDGLRIGIQCIRVNRFPTDDKNMAEIDRIIRGREAEQERLMLKFVNTSKSGSNGFTGSREMDHGFVINPVAKGKGPSVGNNVFDVEEGGGGKRGKVKNMEKKAMEKTKTKEQRRLEQLERSEALSRDAVNAFEIEGSSLGPKVVERWTPICAPWEGFIYWAHEQARLDVAQLLCYIMTRNVAVLACVISLVGSGMVAGDNKGDTAGWSAFCKIDLPYKILVRNYVLCTLVALPLGFGLQILELSRLPTSQPWWCVLITRDEITSGRTQLEDDRETYTDGSGSSASDELVDPSAPDPSVCDYYQECPVCDGKWPIAYILLGSVIMIVETYFRFSTLSKAIKGHKRIFAWADREQEVLHHCAALLQAKTRGRQTRKRIAEEHGIVTRAVAGIDRLSLFYRPDNLVDKKVQEIMALWHKQRRPQSLHSIRSKTSEIHRTMMEVKKQFDDADDNGNAILELDEVKGMMEITGIKLSTLEVEWLFAECYAPCDMSQEKGKSATGRGGTVRAKKTGGGSDKSNGVAFADDLDKVRRKTPLLRHLYIKNGHFTKTGSGQT